MLSLWANRPQALRVTRPCPLPSRFLQNFLKDSNGCLAYRRLLHKDAAIPFPGTTSIFIYKAAVWHWNARHRRHSRGTFSENDCSVGICMVESRKSPSICVLSIIPFSLLSTDNALY